MSIASIPMRKIFIGGSIISILTIEVLTLYWNPQVRWAYLILTPLIALGISDMRQARHAIKRNYPVLGRMRYLFEMVRPEINQYFVESDLDGRPFDREQRSNIYQRAKQALNTRPFGTKRDVYQVGYEWINHSLTPRHPEGDPPRVLVGGEYCKQPYSCSLFNISAMSYGSLSKNAVLALNRGAKEGGFAHNTGEGGISPYHREYKGDLIWQIGTGYFGCRTPDGQFSPENFQEKASWDSVKMIEIKLSQGAKPGHGGILPAAKLTPEVAEIRGVAMGHDVLSPPAHRAFSNPVGLMQFVAQLRELSGGKPIGFKLCIGKKHEFLSICKAMQKTGILPDFITVDGSEGGTGAAPLEFSDSIGMPLSDGLVFVHNALVGLEVRDQIRVMAAGKISTGFHLASAIAKGADICNSARGMMFALGCIQALQCHANTCPTGVATQNAELVRGLVVEDKYQRVSNYHRETIESFMEILGAAGLSHPSELKPWDINRRVSISEVRNLAELYDYIPSGSLLHKPYPFSYSEAWELADAHSFCPIQRSSSKSDITKQMAY